MIPDEFKAKVRNAVLGELDAYLLAEDGNPDRPTDMSVSDTIWDFIGLMREQMKDAQHDS